MQEALRSLAQLPPFSPVLNRLLASLAREDVSFAKLSDLLEKDAVLAGNILRLVNSALYGRRGAVNSVRHAVSILGVTKLRNAALGMSITRMWSHLQTPNWSMARFNLHSVATAMLADQLSQAAPVSYAEGAFVAGLLHDLGRLLIVIGLPEECREIHRLRQQGGGPVHVYEERVLGLSHAELSAAALAAWNLPEAIQMAVRLHHTPEPEPTPPGKGQFPLSFVLNKADDYVNHMGMSIESFTRERAVADDQSLEAFRLGDALPRLLKDFHAELDAMKAFF
jgi:HD-like signal output (HDOD) protein